MNTLPEQRISPESEDLTYYRSVNNCPRVEVYDADSIEIHGYHLYVHKDGLASQVKAVIQLSPWQFRQLLRKMVNDGLEIDDWSCVDLSMWGED